jgi:signal transduction histidine kinase
MKFEIAILFVLALSAQVVNAAWHGFDPIDDGLQLASATTLALLVLRLARARTQRRKRLILQVLDELGQPLTVFQGYVSMLADGTLTTLNGKVEVLKNEVDEMRGLTRKLVDEIRRG